MGKNKECLFTAGLLVFLLLRGSLVFGQDDPPFTLDVPYVPTPEVIVDEMLHMAEVDGNDVLFDLGCGDGRIPITAAKRFGTRGVGIDLNPERVNEAKEKARKEEVSHKIQFLEGNLFDLDLEEATVISLYLFPEVNMKLRPKLLSLKPGTRVISHNYDMGDWKPEKTRKIKAPNGSEHTLYLWRVPPQ